MCCQPIRLSTTCIPEAPLSAFVVAGKIDAVSTAFTLQHRPFLVSMPRSKLKLSQLASICCHFTRVIFRILYTHFEFWLRSKGINHCLTVHRFGSFPVHPPLAPCTIQFNAVLANASEGGKDVLYHTI